MENELPARLWCRSSGLHLIWSSKWWAVLLRTFDGRLCFDLILVAVFAYIRHSLVSVSQFLLFWSRRVSGSEVSPPELASTHCRLSFVAPITIFFILNYWKDFILILRCFNEPALNGLFSSHRTWFCYAWYRFVISNSFALCWHRLLLSSVIWGLHWWETFLYAVWRFAIPWTIEVSLGSSECCFTTVAICNLFICI